MASRRARLCASRALKTVTSKALMPDLDAEIDEAASEDGREPSLPKKVVTCLTTSSTTDESRLPQKSSASPFALETERSFPPYCAHARSRKEFIRVRCERCDGSNQKRGRSS